jgi:uncharacterized RDD family membrane protein YckC
MRESVLTPDGSLVDVNPAGLGARFVALILDTALVTGALALIGGLTRLFLPVGVDYAIMAFLGLFAGMFYAVFSEMRLAGQTVGKRLMGLRVVDAQARQLVLSQSIVRNVARTIDFLPVFYGFGALAALGDRLGRRLGDHIAGTVVVQERQGALPLTFEVKPWSETSLTRADVRRRALARLSLDEREFIFAMMDREHALTAAARFDLFEEAARHYRRRLQLPDVEGLSSENFIRIVATALDDRSAVKRKAQR